MKENKSQNQVRTYVCNRVRVADYLVQRGFMPYRITQNVLNPEYDVFLFTATPELYQTVGEYIMMRRAAAGASAGAAPLPVYSTFAPQSPETPDCTISQAEDTANPQESAALPTSAEKGQYTMSKNQNRNQNKSHTLSSTYVCRRLRVADYLMQRGFQPYRIAPNKDDPKNDVFLFTASPELYQAVIDYMCGRFPHSSSEAAAPDAVSAAPAGFQLPEVQACSSENGEE